MNHCSDDLIPLKKLIELLKHLNALTTIKKGDEEPTYFMPCVLKNATADKMRCIPTSSESDPAPLMIRYDCGYTPLGLFPAIITNIVSLYQEDWELVEEGLRKNRVQFQIGEDCDTVTLILHPEFIEIALLRNQESESPEPTEQVCAEILTCIKSTLQNVTSSNFRMGYKFGFKCSKHSGADHLCVLPMERSKNMRCLKTNKPVRKEDRHKIWFSAPSNGM